MLMEILKAYGVPVEIVDAVNIMYTNTTAQVLPPSGNTEFFEILAKVLQGDTLTQLFSIIALDKQLETKATQDSLSIGREAGDTQPR